MSIKIEGETGFPAILSEPHHTPSGTPYLTSPGVAVLCRPNTYRRNLEGFLGGFDAGLDFDQYLDDPDRDNMDDGAHIAMIAGQTCYLSFGRQRSMCGDAWKYLDRIKAQAHGSVVEHANYTMLFYGVSRSVTHELVRHRAGIGFSQVSQRYVSGKTLRFVERPEYQADHRLHYAFEKRIDQAVVAYDSTAERLQVSMAQQLAGLSKTEARKAVNQAARSCLPNETEAPIVVTANIRAWRHFLEMRCSRHAEPEIRGAAYRAYLCLNTCEPLLFGDYAVTVLPDGTYELDTPYRKV